MKLNISLFKWLCICVFLKNIALSISLYCHFQEILAICIAVISINNKNVLGDALSSQDEHISLIEYQPLLKLMRQSRQDVRFNRSPAVPGYSKDDYGRRNEISSLPKFTYPSAKSYPGSISYNVIFCIEKIIHLL